MASGALWGPHPKKHRFLPLRHSLFREMPLKERFVAADAFYRLCRFAGHQIGYPVNQQERAAMGKYLFNLFKIQFHFFSIYP